MSALYESQQRSRRALVYPSTLAALADAIEARVAAPSDPTVPDVVPTNEAILELIQRVIALEAR
jgi:hypothetical protein